MDSPRETGYPAHVHWEEDRFLADDLALQKKEALPALRILRIPVRNDGANYASLLNWIQLGSNLIVPKFEITEEEDIEQTRKLLEAEGFKPTFIESPTLDTGGSLHCLTASIHLQA